MAAAVEVVNLHVEEQHYPRYDDAHGTPDPMVRRTLSILLPEGVARFEQTDYGHPGRWNAWDARGIDTRLQPKAEALRALCDALTPLLG
jgi:hypothetical protein